MEDKALSKKKKLVYTNNNLFYTKTNDKLRKIDAIQPHIKQSFLIFWLSFFNSNLIWIKFGLRFESASNLIWIEFGLIGFKPI